MTPTQPSSTPITAEGAVLRKAAQALVDAHPVRGHHVAALRAALAATLPAAIQPAACPTCNPVRCVICQADEPRTGTCGSSDPRALCNLAPAASNVEAVSDGLIGELQAEARQAKLDDFAQAYLKSAPIEAGELPPLPQLPLCDASYSGGRFYDTDTMQDYARAYGQLCRDTARPASSVTSAPEDALRKELAGWMDEAAARQRMIDGLTAAANLRHQHDSKDFWYWQGDGSDHLESMSNGMAVLIRADHLRDLLATKPASTASIAADAEFVRLVHAYRRFQQQSDFLALVTYLDARPASSVTSGRKVGDRTDRDADAVDADKWRTAPATGSIADDGELRAKFERWCYNDTPESPNFQTARNALGDYDFAETDGAWHAWQYLARQSVAAPDARDAAIAMWNATGEQLQKADDTLRSLSSYVGQGLCADTENLDYDEMEARIKEGIDAIIKVEASRAPVQGKASDAEDAALPMIWTVVLDEVARATRKFPTWPTDPLHALAVLGEEFGELTKAVLQTAYEPHKVAEGELRMEAIQTAAMSLRFLASLDSYEFTRSAQHEQADAARAQQQEKGGAA